MADKIFTRLVVKKKDLFATMLAKMTEAGWTRLNGSASNSANVIVMHSKGVAGDRPMYIMIAPFDGASTVGNAAYDVRITDYVDMVYQIGSGYDASTGIVTAPFEFNSWQTFPIWSMHARDFPNGDGAGSVPNSLDMDIEFYYCISADSVTMLFVPPKGTARASTLTFFGIPEKEFLQEVKSPAYSHMVMGTTGRCTTNRNVRVLNRPQAWSRTSTGYGVPPIFTLSPMSPNIDGVYQLSEMYYGATDEGFRGRWGNGVMLLPVSSGIVDGDTIQVTVNGSPQTYRYTRLAAHSAAALLDYATVAIAIRIS